MARAKTKQSSRHMQGITVEGDLLELVEYLNFISGI